MSNKIYEINLKFGNKKKLKDHNICPVGFGNIKISKNTKYWFP